MHQLTAPFSSRHSMTKENICWLYTMKMFTLTEWPQQDGHELGAKTPTTIYHPKCSLCSSKAGPSILMLSATAFRVSSIMPSGPQATTAMRSDLAAAATVDVMIPGTLGLPCWMLNAPLTGHELVISFCFSMSNSDSEGVADVLSSGVRTGVDVGLVEWMSIV